MIVGETFIWTHFPKTAGHAVDRALRRAARGKRDVCFDRRRAHDAFWHESPRQRRARDPSFSIEGKTVIAGIRRLPHWVLSRVFYEAARPPHRVPTREMLREGRFFEQDGTPNFADAYMEVFEDEVARWLRTEHLREDFHRHFSDVLGPSVHIGVKALDKIVNGTSMPYVKQPSFHFTAAELARLYDANPRWKAKELEVYGDLLSH